MTDFGKPDIRKWSGPGATGYIPETGHSGEGPTALPTAVESDWGKIHVVLDPGIPPGILWFMRTPPNPPTGAEQYFRARQAADPEYRAAYLSARDLEPQHTRTVAEFMPEGVPYAQLPWWARNSPDRSPGWALRRLPDYGVHCPILGGAAITLAVVAHLLSFSDLFGWRIPEALHWAGTAGIFTAAGLLAYANRGSFIPRRLRRRA